MTYYFAVVAYDQNRTIGNNNQLLWRLPDDLKHFKQLTLGKPLVMGRKTFESIGRSLPNRRNIILTRDPSFRAVGCEVVHSVAALQKLVASEPEVMIGGGAEIYRLLLPVTTKIYATEIEVALQGDAHFVALDPKQWCEVSRHHHAVDVAHPYAFDFVEYVLKI